jgi:mitochondrial distribution and morphology protein 10
MREFTSYVLQSFKDATGWSRDNGYSALNETADGSSTPEAIGLPETCMQTANDSFVLELLNFQTPGGLRLNLSSLATAQFATSYTLGSVGVVDGSISYLYSSVPLGDMVAQSEKIPLTTLLRSYRQLRDLSCPDLQSRGSPSLSEMRIPSLTDIVHNARKLLEKPTLLYGRLYLPKSMLEALVIKRVAPSVQVQVMAVSDGQLRNGGTLLGMVQVDRDRYGLEGLASSDGGLLGIRGLYNFGGDASQPTHALTSVSERTVEEVLPSVNGGDKDRIYGRFSVGGEVYYGTLNKSGGVSMGARFATLPSHRGTPLTATLTINPLMGNISATYAVVAREYCSLASKFEFNVYSYESDWAVGMELWSKRRLAGLVDTGRNETPSSPTPLQRPERSFQAKLEWRLDSPEQVRREDQTLSVHKDGDNDYRGVLKARLDQNLKVGLLWEGRAKSLLFSLGTAVDLNKLNQPFRTVGLEVLFSS